MKRELAIGGYFATTGLAAFKREGDALLLDFVSYDQPGAALRVMMAISIAEELLPQLRSLTAMLEAQKALSSVSH